jgi:hypothetical protein
VFLVAVFHQSNWTSVHPPHICLAGSNMRIVEDGLLGGEGEVPGSVGRIVTVDRGNRRKYLSLYVYGAAGLQTGRYSEFVLHHLPRALLRRGGVGYLMRVETWVEGDDMAAAEARCRRFLTDAVAAAEALVRG